MSMFLVAFNLSSANTFNFDKAKILSSGKGLISFEQDQIENEGFLSACQHYFRQMYTARG